MMHILVATGFKKLNLVLVLKTFLVLTWNSVYNSFKNESKKHILELQATLRLKAANEKPETINGQERKKEIRKLRDT